LRRPARALARTGRDRIQGLRRNARK
jgi:hypothetical protein